MLSGRAALVAAFTAVIAYFAWTAAAADDFEARNMWTVLTAGVFWLAVLVLVLYLGSKILGMLRSGR